MTWEKRHPYRGRYYTLTRTRHGRRVRLYFGNGWLGEVAASLNELLHEAQQQKSQAWNEEKQRCQELQSRNRTWHLAVQKHLNRALPQVGQKPGNPTMKSKPKTPRMEPRKSPRNTGSPDRQNPLSPDLKIQADLGQMLEQEWLHIIAGDHVGLKTALQQQVQAMKKGLSPGPADQLEQLLLQRVGTTWLESHYWDLLATQHAALSPAQRRQLERQQENAGTRHAQALLSLGQYQTLCLHRK